MRIATFNLQNLRLRTHGGLPALDGAADQDRDDMRRPAELALADRHETARVIAAAQADILALQEVFDRDALDHFHDRFLGPAGAPAYPHRICLPGNDGRGLNVAALSRTAPRRVTSHAARNGADLGLTDLPPDLRDQPIFRRDCLELDLGPVTLFICHFKAPYPDAHRAWQVRRAEARAVRRLVETRFADPASARWIILGDLNEPARDAGSAIAPLTEGFAVSLLDRLSPGTDWTYEVPDTHQRARPDRILLSPRLAREHPRTLPRILRTGLGSDPGATAPPHASDHALVYADYPGLAEAAP